LIIADIQPKQNRLQILASEADELNDISLVNQAKQLTNQLERLQTDLSVDDFS
jgi:hypothetical protein